MKVTRKMKLSDINIDRTLMVREINSYYVARYAEALRAGAVFPPLVIDKETGCLTCGFHRYRAYEIVFDLSFEVEVIEKDYKDNQEKFLDAIKDNQTNGQPLYVVDIRRSVLRGVDMGISIEDLASALSITVKKANKYFSEKVKVIKKNNEVEMIPNKPNTGIKNGSIVKEKVAEHIKTKYIDKTVSSISRQLIMRLQDDTFDKDYDGAVLIQLADLIYKKVGV